MPDGSQRSIARVTEIGRVATRHGFGYLVDRRRATDGEPDGDRGRRLREMLDELGPTFVKFGQLLSTRPDVVPPDIIVELQKLQDDVRPFPIEDVERVVHEELGLGIERAFLSFDEQPIAAASIGQVHRATLPNHEDVVVKVQRPSAPRQIESDLRLMASVARLARERVRQLDFLDTGELVDEFGRSIRQELDYQQEARNAEAFRRNFAGNEQVVVPRVWWRYTTSRLLTLERLEGTHVRDLDLAAWDDADRRDLAYRMTDAWMTMIFRHAFFHGDPHPSNILHLDDGRLGLVDFSRTRTCRASRVCSSTRRRRTSPRCRVDWPTWASGIRASGRTSCGHASRSSTTATTALASRRSTRSRPSGTGST
jgi:ubiquinone biosynthesis protein